MIMVIFDIITAVLFYLCYSIMVIFDIIIAVQWKWIKLNLSNKSGVAACFVALEFSEKAILQWYLHHSRISIKK